MGCSTQYHVQQLVKLLYINNSILLLLQFHIWPFIKQASACFRGAQQEWWCYAVGMATASSTYGLAHCITPPPHCFSTPIILAYIVYPFSPAWLHFLDCHNPADGGNKLLWSVDNFLPIDMASYPRRLPSSSTPLWEPQISKAFASVSHNLPPSTMSLKTCNCFHCSCADCKKMTYFVFFLFVLVLTTLCY